jgi:hypothetical protein
MQKIEERLPPDKMKMNGLYTRKLLMQLLKKVVLTRGEYLILEAIMIHMEFPIEEANWTSFQLTVLAHSLTG